MQVITDKTDIQDFLLSLGADSDGGNFALVGGKQAICIDHAFHDDGRELWYSCLYQSIDWVHTWSDMTGEMGNPIEIRVYDNQKDAMSDYVERVMNGTNQYLEVCP